MTANSRAPSDVRSRPQRSPHGEVGHILQSAKADEWRSGPSSQLALFTMTAALGAASKAARRRVRCTSRKCPQVASDQVRTGCSVTSTAALGAANKAARKARPGARVIRKAPQSPSDQFGADVLVTITAALGAANKAARKTLPSPSVSPGHWQSAWSVTTPLGYRPVRSEGALRSRRSARPDAPSEGCSSRLPSVPRRAPNEWH
jgi:hypothetical protein